MTAVYAGAFEYANWLMSLKNFPCREILPVRVRIGDKYSYEGAFSAEIQRYGSQERFVTDGLVRAGEEYVRYRLELLGLRPKKLANRVNYVLVWEHGHPLDERAVKSIGEWYVACYYEGQDRNEYHPYGPSFTLMDHTVHVSGYYKDWKIDTGERHTCPRIPMTVEFM